MKINEPQCYHLAWDATNHCFQLAINKDAVRDNNELNAGFCENIAQSENLTDQHFDRIIGSKFLGYNRSLVLVEEQQEINAYIYKLDVPQFKKETATLCLRCGGKRGGCLDCEDTGKQIIIDHENVVAAGMSLSLVVDHLNKTSYVYGKEQLYVLNLLLQLRPESVIAVEFSQSFLEVLSNERLQMERMSTTVKDAMVKAFEISGMTIHPGLSRFEVGWRPQGFSLQGPGSPHSLLYMTENNTLCSTYIDAAYQGFVLLAGLAVILDTVSSLVAKRQSAILCA